MTVVVKLGGDAVNEPDRLASDVGHLVANGERVIVVHGGSSAIDATLSELGRAPHYVETPGGVTSRFTDSETMDAVTMATARVNRELVTALRAVGVDAVGLSGIDGGLLTGERKSAVKIVEDGRKRIERGDHAGTVESVDTDLLSTLTTAGRTPVVTVPVLADDGTAVNTDADRAAAAIAGALAESDSPSGRSSHRLDRGEEGVEFVLLTETAGVYADPTDPTTLIESVETPAEFEQLREAAEGFMHRKVLAVEDALTAGCRRAVIADATVRDPLIAARQGGGTQISDRAVEREVHA